jgi:hypothetical protein
MTDHPFNNDATQAERRRVLRNDRASTFFAQALAEAGMVGGRWSKQHEAKVTGAAQYPRADLPAWVGADRAVEPPIGVAVDAQAPVGETHEIEASIAAIDREIE